MFLLNGFPLLCLFTYLSLTHGLTCQVGYEVGIPGILSQSSYSVMQCPLSPTQNCVSLPGAFSATINVGFVSIPATGTGRVALCVNATSCSDSLCSDPIGVIGTIPGIDANVLAAASPTISSCTASCCDTDECNAQAATVTAITTVAASGGRSLEWSHRLIVSNLIVLLAKILCF